MLVRKGKKIVEKKKTIGKERLATKRENANEKKRDHGKRKLPKPFIPALII